MKHIPCSARTALALLAILLLASPPRAQEGSKRVIVIVRVAPDARLTVDGAATTPTGAVRQFRSPPLRAGGYTYKLQATWNDAGQELQAERQITFRAGQTVEVDLRTADSPPTPKTEFSEEERRLMKEKLETARQEFDVSEANFRAGRSVHTSMLAEYQHLVDAGLEYFQESSERVKLLEELVRIARALEERAQAQIQAALGEERDVLAIRYMRLDAELRLLREKKKAK